MLLGVPEEPEATDVKWVSFVKLLLEDSEAAANGPEHGRGRGGGKANKGSKLNIQALIEVSMLLWEC